MILENGQKIFDLTGSLNATNLSKNNHNIAFLQVKCKFWGYEFFDTTPIIDFLNVKNEGAQNVTRLNPSL